MLLSSFLLSLGIPALAAAVPVGWNSTGLNNTSSTLPTIDLGYAVYSASYYNESYDAYVFSNIRFAAPPTGALRFGPPQPPLKDRSRINNGSVGFSCPQALPAYLGYSSIITEDVSEDCLFLDVIVPRKVLSGEYGKVPVLVWLYGGGYVLGFKTQAGDPTDFLRTSPSPVVYVAPNYRLGAFGWLSGPTFTLSNDTVPNAGLYDQRFALKWVQKNIHLFHGSKDQVTVMGASAGAGSIMHQITAFGGEGETLFHRAIPIGPGFNPQGAHSASEDGYTSFQQAAGCSGKGIECLRAISTEKLQEANKAIVTAAQAPSLGFGPAIDGDLVPDLPSYLFYQGRFQKNLAILVSDDIDEGSLFVGNKSSLSVSSIKQIFPGISNSTISELMSLYPPPNKSTPYTTEQGRLIKIIADSGFNCNRYAMSAALPNATYNLLTSIQPGTHGTWPQHLFNNIQGSEAVVTDDILYATRRFVMNFVVGGTPNELQGGSGTGVGSQELVWPVFGSDGRGLNVTMSALTVVSAAADREVCEWWGKALFLS